MVLACAVPTSSAASRPRVLSRCGNGTRDGTLTFLLGPLPALTRALIHPPRLTLVLPRSPNSKRMAAVTTDRVVQLFDDNGDKRDKFSTKPSNPDGPKNFVVRGMAFSPDSTKLAIAQSDNIVFVYKLGVEWGDKKSICNKFLQHHPVAALAWPQERRNEVVFASPTGKSSRAAQDQQGCRPIRTPRGLPRCLRRLQSQRRRRVQRPPRRLGVDLLVRHRRRADLRDSCVPYALSWGAGFVCAAGRIDASSSTTIAAKGIERPRCSTTREILTNESFRARRLTPPARRLWLARLTDPALTRDARGHLGEAGRKDVANLYTVSALSGNRTDRNSPLERCAVWWMCTMRVFEGKDTATPSSSRTCRGRRWLSNDSPPARESSAIAPRLRRVQD